MTFNILIHSARGITAGDQPMKGVYGVVTINNIQYKTEICKHKERRSFNYPTTPVEKSFLDRNLGLKLENNQGNYVVVTEVYKDSEADLNGIIPGMFIIGLNGVHQSYTAEEITAVIEQIARPLKITFLYPTKDTTNMYYEAYWEQQLCFPAGATLDSQSFSISLIETDIETDRSSSSSSLVNNELSVNNNPILFQKNININRYENWTGEISSIYNQGSIIIDTFWNNENIKEESLDTKVSIHFEGFGLSLIDKDPKELMYLHVSDVNFNYLAYQSNKQAIEAKIKNVQIDDELQLTTNPVLFGCENQTTNQFLHFSTILYSQPNIIYIEYLGIALHELAISLDSHFLLELIDFIMSLKLDLLKTTDEQGVLTLKNSQDFNTYIEIPAIGTSSHRLFAELFQIHPFSVSISNHIDPAYSLTSKVLSSNGFFLPIETLFSTLQTVLGNIDHVTIPFKSFITEDIFMYQDTLVNQVINHYTYEGIKNAYKFIGGVNILGNPVGLFENIGTGVKAFFYEPYQGMVKGPEAFNAGLSKGTKALLKNTTYGFFNSASVLTGAIGDSITSLTFNQEYKSERASGKRGFVHGITSGFTGIVMDPVHGAKENGFVGALEGIGKGLIGVVTKPIAGAFDGASDAFDMIRDSTKLYTKMNRKRLPRYIGLDDKIEQFNYFYSHGQHLLALSQSKKKSDLREREKYIYHCVVDNDSHFLLITRYHILLLTKDANTLWCLPLQAIRVLNNGEELRLIVNNEQYTIVMASEQITDKVVALIKGITIWEDMEIVQFTATIVTYMNQKSHKATPMTLPNVETLELKSVSLLRIQTRYEQKNAGLFKLTPNSYTEYVLEVKGGEPTYTWTIYRRFKEFQHYYQELQKVLPKNTFTSIKFPEKKLSLFGKHIEHDVEKERQELFTTFIQTFVNQPEILSLISTSNFLKTNPINLHLGKN